MIFGNNICYKQTKINTYVETYVYYFKHMYEMIFGTLHMYCRRLIAYICLLICFISRENINICKLICLHMFWSFYICLLYIFCMKYVFRYLYICMQWQDVSTYVNGYVWICMHWNDNRTYVLTYVSTYVKISWTYVQYICWLKCWHMFWKTYVKRQEYSRHM